MTPREANADLLAEITALRDRVASLRHENAELQGALAQASHREAATSEILRVISRSPADVQPVFAAIVRSAVRLCGGTISTLYRYDGNLIHFEVTSHPSGIPPAITRGQFPRPADTSSLIGRAIVERAVVNVADMETDPRANPGIGRVASRERGFRSMVIVPMFRENQTIGVITVGRAEPGEFSDSDIGLLKTFSDQAVIAIENVRLFKELEARNRELTDSTSEGGRIEVAAVPKDGFVEVSVNDTGVGIAPEDQEAVFQEFRQVGTAEKKAEGTGLGLTLCRKFIELHRGRIWVKSQVGQGSTFIFTILVRQGG
jgi:transcriptional regulator with GAF, ATPase, and Fis domain